MKEIKIEDIVEVPIFIIGIDTNAYCLVKSQNGKTEILLSKVIKNKKQFEKEVTNLSIYFNAKIYRENN